MNSKWTSSLPIMLPHSMSLSQCLDIFDFIMFGVRRVIATAMIVLNQGACECTSHVEHFPPTPFWNSSDI